MRASKEQPQSAPAPVSRRGPEGFKELSGLYGNSSGDYSRIDSNKLKQAVTRLTGIRDCLPAYGRAADLVKAKAQRARNGEEAARFLGIARDLYQRHARQEEAHGGFMLAARVYLQDLGDEQGAKAAYEKQAAMERSRGNCAQAAALEAEIAAGRLPALMVMLRYSGDPKDRERFLLLQRRK